jgi:hypothetical protein
MNKKNLLITAGLVAALAACSQIPKEAYYSRGEPESLIDKSSEVINLKIQSPASVDEITNWLNKDQPTRAELKCSETDDLCSEVQSVLHQFGVPVRYSPTPENSVALIYERIQARDCESRYIDNMINPYNLNHPTFGCTIAVNSVQMVADKRVFVDPALMGESDAAKVVQAYGFYGQPSTYTPPKVDANFNDIATQQNLQTTGLTGGNSSR